MIYLMYKSAKFGLVLTVTYLQIYIYKDKSQSVNDERAKANSSRGSSVSYD